MKKIIALIAILAAATLHSSAATATFDSQPDGYLTPDGTDVWTDAGMNFTATGNSSEYNGETYYSWNGMTYSDVNDTTTEGYDNQYAVYGDGMDYSDGGSYVIVYDDGYNTPTISFDSAMTVNGLYVNNTTYAALAMLNGTYFSGAYTTGDWFTLSIYANGETDNAVIVDLADFTDYENGKDAEDYMLTDWEYVDLTGLGDNVTNLQFSVSSSDTSGGYINTPTYFALDNIDAVPEPASALLALTGLATVFVMRRKKQAVDDK